LKGVRGMVLYLQEKSPQNKKFKQTFNKSLFEFEFESKNTDTSFSTEKLVLLTITKYTRPTVFYAVKEVYWFVFYFRIYIIPLISSLPPYWLANALL